MHSNSEVLAYVSGHPQAIGYVSLAYANPEVKTVWVNGIRPDLKSPETSQYPIFRKLYLYVRAPDFTRDVRSFIVFLLGNEGQQIVEQNGFKPLYPLSFKDADS